MATRKQIAVNRKNAKKSTGPKTAPGKITSSHNAVKYGLLCQDFFRLPWEDSEALQSMRDLLFNELRPQGMRELLLAEHIFRLYWRLQRGAVAEAGILLHRVRDVTGLGPNPYAKPIPTRRPPDESGDESGNGLDQDLPGPGNEEPRWIEAPEPQPRVVDIGGAYILDVQEGDALSKVRRHEISLENSLSRALREFERLQEKRIASMPDAPSGDSDLPAPKDTNASDSDKKAA